MMGDIKFEASQTLPDFGYAQYAESLGLTGIKVDRPEMLGDAWDRALGADRPVVLEAVTDPDVPTLPPHITIEQAKNFMTSLVKGDPDEGGILKHAVKEMVAAVMPRRE
jgi:pyruvate dehydrogenase (quinone)